MRDPRLADEWRKQKAEAVRLPLPATFGSRHVWLPPDPGVAPGLPSNTSLAQRKFILVCILTGAPANIRGRPLLVRVS